LKVEWEKEGAQWKSERFGTVILYSIWHEGFPGESQQVVSAGPSNHIDSSMGDAKVRNGEGATASQACRRLLPRPPTAATRASIDQRIALHSLPIVVVFDLQTSTDTSSHDVVKSCPAGAQRWQCCYGKVSLKPALQIL